MLHDELDLNKSCHMNSQAQKYLDSDTVFFVLFFFFGNFNLYSAIMNLIQSNQDAFEVQALNFNVRGLKEI